MLFLPAGPDDVADATQCLAAAFATDPLIDFLFKDNPQGTLDWPTPLEREMHALDAGHPAFAERFAAYEGAVDAGLPPGPH